MAAINKKITTLIILKPLVVNFFLDQLKLMLELFEVDFLFGDTRFFGGKLRDFLLED
jgi:hypothetical protein